MKWLEEATKQKNHWHEIYSFFEYMEQVTKGPRSYVRSTGIYLKDMFHYFGQDEKGEFLLFKKEYPGSIPIYGQQQCQQKIYQNLLNFCEEGSNNKLILLVGPNGSAKTSLIKKIMLAAEEYSQKDEGLLHTFSWIFPSEGHLKGALGLQNTHRADQLKPFAHLEDSEITAIINSDLRDHPLLLIPIETRQKFLGEWFADDANFYDAIKKSSLFYGKLATKNQMIYDALLKNYKGNHLQVLKHIRVERFAISRSQSISAVSVEPQMHVDAKMHQITMDKRLSALPPSLQSLNLYQLQGEAVWANRGVLEFSDLLKRPLDAFKYLLMTVETKSINLQGVLVELDVFFIGTSNDVHLQAFKQHPDFNSFKGRMIFICVPYLVSIGDEANIYREQITSLRNHSKFDSGALEALCLFAVMTRIRPIQESSFANKQVGQLACKLTPIEKALFLSKNEMPESLNVEERQLLQTAKKTIREEYKNDNLYEGNFGISPREIKQIIYEVSAKNNIVSFVEIIDYLTKFIERKNEYEFLSIPAQGSYHNPAYFIRAVKKYSLNQFDSQLRSSLGLVDDCSYEKYIAKYIMHISALLKGEKVQDPLTEENKPSDTYFIQEFESNIDLKEDPNKFRTHMISKLGAFSLDNQGVPIVYTDVFPEIAKKLKESFKQEQRKKIKNIANNIVYYLDEKNNEQQSLMRPLSKENREEITNVLDNLKKNFHYSEAGGIKLLKYTIKEQYQEIFSEPKNANTPKL